MEKIKKQIKISGFDIYLKIFIQQSIYNIGTFTDVPFLFEENKTNNNSNNNFVRSPHMSLDNITINQKSNKITAYVESELKYFYRYGNINSYSERFLKKQFIIENLKVKNGVISVKDVFLLKKIFLSNDYFIEGLDVDVSDILGYTESSQNINELIESKIEYRYGLGIDDENIEFPNYGISYTEIEGPNENNVIGKYLSQGYNYTNSSIYANIKEEHLLGISEKHNTENNISIDRKNGINVFEIIQKLGEINNVEHLSHYNNGEFNILK